VAEPVVLRPFGWPVFAFNLKAGIMTDPNIRLAVQAALSPDDMLYAAFGDENFFAVDGPLYPEGYIWRNEAGVEHYNQADPERAAEYLEAAGYDGTPLRILTSHQYEFHFKMAEVAKVNLEMAGFTVEMQVVDWATLGERRNVPELWDIYITHSPFLPEPALTSLFNADAQVGWADEEKEKVLSAFTSETDTEKRGELFADNRRYGIQQAHSVGVLWLVEHLANRAIFHNFTGVHRGNAVSELGRETEIVADEDHGEIELLAQALDYIDDRALGDDIQGSGWLIENEQVGIE